MAEAERIIGTPDTPDADRDGQERADADGADARAAEAPAGGSGTE
ncbi:signal peptidase II, partial [Streptomyces sp. 15-116A]|nr:signal peptidase II [Streptomyces sp. 15-116A]